MILSGITFHFTKGCTQLELGNITLSNLEALAVMKAVLIQIVQEVRVLLSMRLGILVKLVALKGKNQNVTVLDVHVKGFDLIT